MHKWAAVKSPLGAQTVLGDRHDPVVRCSSANSVGRLRNSPERTFQRLGTQIDARLKQLLKQRWKRGDAQCLKNQRGTKIEGDITSFFPVALSILVIQVELIFSALRLVNHRSPRSNSESTHEHAQVHHATLPHAQIAIQ